MRFRIVEEQRGAFPVDRLCRVMNVSPRGLRAFRSRAASRTQHMDMVVLAYIKEQSRLSLGRYDRPRMTEELKVVGVKVAHRRVGRLMRENGRRHSKLLRSIPGIGTVSAAMLIAEMTELVRTTAGEVAAMTGLAPLPHDNRSMRGRRAFAGGRRALRHVLYHAALAAPCHNLVLKPVAQRLKTRGKPHMLIIVAIARRLATIINSILKSGIRWQAKPIS